MQDVGPRPIPAGQVRHRLVQEPVSRGDRRRSLRTGDGLRVPAGTLRRVRADLRAEDLARNRHHETARRRGGRRPRHRTEGDQERLAQEPLRIDREAAVRHPDGVVLAQDRDHARADLAGGHQLVGRFQQRVLDHRRLDVDDDAEEPVAAHHETEELGVLGRRAGDEVAGGEHHAAGPDRRPEGTERDGPAVRVHAQGRRDAEVVVGLHHRGREAQGIERADHLAPPCAGGDPVGLRGAIDVDPRTGRRLHVEGHRDPVADERLTPHRVPRGAHRDGATLGRRRLQLRAEGTQPCVAAHLFRPPVARDRDGIEATGIVEDERLRRALGLGGQRLQESGGDAGAEQRATGHRLGRPRHHSDSAPPTAAPSTLPGARAGLISRGSPLLRARRLARATRARCSRAAPRAGPSAAASRRDERPARGGPADRPACRSSSTTASARPA